MGAGAFKSKKGKEAVDRRTKITNDHLVSFEKMENGHNVLSENENTEGGLKISTHSDENNVEPISVMSKPNDESNKSTSHIDRTFDDRRDLSQPFVHDVQTVTDNTCDLLPLNTSYNIERDIADTNNGHKISSHSKAQLDDNNSSSSAGKKGLSHESDCSQNDNNDGVDLTDGNENYKPSTEIMENADIDSESESKDQFDIIEKTEISSKTLPPEPSTSIESGENEVIFQNNLNDNILSGEDFVKQSGDKIETVDATATINEQRLSFPSEEDNDHQPTENNNNEKKVDVELPEYRLNENVLFYKNKLCSKPFPGARIEEMLTWKGDYQKLERSHSYIQWLFPIPESRGMNYSAQPLQEHEAKIISKDVELKNKVLEAFKMMLDFYGMELDSDTDVIQIKRAENWEERYKHLNRSTHNNFRITRIIKSLGELGLKDLQVPWIEFLMNEAVTDKVLKNLNDQTFSHFIDALKEEDEKWKMYSFLSDLNSHSNRPGESNQQQEDVSASLVSGHVTGDDNNNQGTLDSKNNSDEAFDSNQTKRENGAVKESDKENEIDKNSRNQNCSDTTFDTEDKEVNGTNTEQTAVKTGDKVHETDSVTKTVICDDSKPIESKSENNDDNLKMNNTMHKDFNKITSQEIAGVNNINVKMNETNDEGGNLRQNSNENIREIIDDKSKLKTENYKVCPEQNMEEKQTINQKECSQVYEMNGTHTQEKENGGKDDRTDISSEHMPRRAQSEGDKVGDVEEKQKSDQRKTEND